jgi:hypothetical protein
MSAPHSYCLVQHILFAGILVLPNRMDPFWQQRVMHVLTAGMWYVFS